MEKYLRLFEYHSWSINRMLCYIEKHCPSSFNKPVNSVFTTISETFGHLYWADQIWFDRIKGVEQRNSLSSFKNVGEARESFELLHETMSLHLRETDLCQKIIYQNTSGTTFENNIEEILAHLVNHGTYHLGNITSMLWSLGEKSVGTDYIIFFREKTKDGA